MFYLVADIIEDVFDVIEMPLMIISVILAVILGAIAIFGVPTLLFIGFIPVVECFALWLACVACCVACFVFVVTRQL